MEDEARELNVGFVSRMTRGRPWVRMKIAASLDGKTALANGSSQWITGPEARRDGHRWRARACAVLTGIGTVQGRRSAAHGARGRDAAPAAARGRRQPARDAARGARARRRHADRGGARGRERARARCEAQGAEVVVLPNAAGKVDLAALMRELARREMNEVHVEAGYKLNGSLLREDLVDELVVYLAPQHPRRRGAGHVRPAGARRPRRQRRELGAAGTCARSASDIRVIARVESDVHRHRRRGRPHRRSRAERRRACGCASRPAGSPLDDVALGDSIAVSGVCLTVVALHADAFEVDVSRETLACTAGFERGARGQSRESAAPLRPARRPPRERPRRRRRHGRARRSRGRQPRCSRSRSRRARALRRAQGLDRGRRREPHGERRRRRRRSPST